MRSRLDLIILAGLAPLLDGLPIRPAAYKLLCELNGDSPHGFQEYRTMPIFEFHCPSCNSDFEQLVRSSKETKGLKCPTCQGSDVSRKISVFSAHAAAAPRACPMPNRSCDQCCGYDGACKL